ncbi:MAG: hypothetical protein OEW16_11935 [Gammaproteobacteria bacterium]|nr:hypothetical protein [Gammaproteobacteria bacterium]
MSAAAWENFHKATLELAKSAALKQRLTDAFSRHLQDMAASEMPRELRGDFESLRKRMTQVSPLRGESAVVATVRKMSLDEADACAARIVALLDALHRVNGSDNAAAASLQTGEPGHAQGSRRPKDSTDTTVRIPTLISINRA